MDDKPKMRSQLWTGARRGAGWALGVGSVVSVAAVLRDGPRPALKAAMKAAIAGREMAAELGEQLQDLYAEARSERLAADGPPDG